MGEIYKDIKGYDGYYQVSNYGNIRSIKNKYHKGKQIAKRLQNSGYYIVSLSVGGECVKKTVHRIVAETFLENKNNYRDVNHKNGIKTDNRVENLEWVSHSDNIKHSYSQLKQKRNIKPVICVETGIIYESCVDAELKTGINRSAINHVVNGISKTAGGHLWERA